VVWLDKGTFYAHCSFNGAGEEDIHVQQARAERLGWDCGMWNHIFPLLNLCRRNERCVERVPKS
jgi:hypothetical protein